MTGYNVKTGGNDGSSGIGDGNAWATVGKVNGFTFSAGDTISFNKGDEWNCNTDSDLVPPSSGSSGSPITFQAYGTGDNPVFNGSLSILGSAGDWTETSGGSNKWTKTQTTTPLQLMFTTGSTVTKGIKESSQAAVTAVNEWFHGSNVLTVYSPNDNVPTTEFADLEVNYSAHAAQLMDLAGGKNNITFK